MENIVLEFNKVWSDDLLARLQGNVSLAIKALIESDAQKSLRMKERLSFYLCVLFQIADNYHLSHENLNKIFHDIIEVFTANHPDILPKGTENEFIAFHHKRITEYHNYLYNPEGKGPKAGFFRVINKNTLATDDVTINTPGLDNASEEAFRATWDTFESAIIPEKRVYREPLEDEILVEGQTPEDMFISIFVNLDMAIGGPILPFIPKNPRRILEKMIEGVARKNTTRQQTHEEALRATRVGYLSNPVGFILHNSAYAHEDEEEQKARRENFIEGMDEYIKRASSIASTIEVYGGGNRAAVMPKIEKDLSEIFEEEIKVLGVDAATKRQALWKQQILEKTGIWVDKVKMKEEFAKLLS